MGIDPTPVCAGEMWHTHWKALDEGYKFALNLIAIEGLHKKLCAFKVVKVLAIGILGLTLGNPGTKNHLDVGPKESCRVYYMGEGGGFPSSLGRGESCESKVARGLS
jgi:hypothetical protein